MGIAVLQFENVQRYDILPYLTQGQPAEQDQASEFLAKDARTQASMKFYMQLQDITSRRNRKNQKEWSAYVYVPESLEGLDELFVFQDRETGEKYELTDEGAIITEKIAKELEIEPGDSIYIQDEDKGEIEIPIAAVCEITFITIFTFLQVFTKKFLEKSRSITAWQSSRRRIQRRIGKRGLEQDAVMSITYTSSLKDQLDHMLSAWIL